MSAYFFSQLQIVFDSNSDLPAVCTSVYFWHSTACWNDVKMVKVIDHLAASWQQLSSKSLSKSPSFYFYCDTNSTIHKVLSALRVSAQYRFRFRCRFSLWSQRTENQIWNATNSNSPQCSIWKSKYDIKPLLVFMVPKSRQ